MKTKMSNLKQQSKTIKTSNVFLELIGICMKEPYWKLEQLDKEPYWKLGQ